MLNPSQMTNFRHFKTGIVCRQQFQIWWNWQKVIQTGRKHCWKRMLLITSNFSFSPSVFKTLVLQIGKNLGLFEKGLTLYQAFSSFPTIFSKHFLGCQLFTEWKILAKSKFEGSEDDKINDWNILNGLKIIFYWWRNSDTKKKKGFTLRNCSNWHWVDSRPGARLAQRVERRSSVTGVVRRAHFFPSIYFTGNEDGIAVCG